MEKYWTADMKFDDLEKLKVQGFTGFLAISELQQIRPNKIRNQPGVYLVVRPYQA
jgi:hypothetical protein